MITRKEAMYATAKRSLRLYVTKLQEMMGKGLGVGEGGVKAAGVAEKEHLFVQVADKSGNEVSSGNGCVTVNRASGQMEKGKEAIVA